MEKVIQAMRERKLYGYIANNYHTLSKQELADIIKELDYAMGDEVLEMEYRDIMENAAVELEDIYLD